MYTSISQNAIIIDNDIKHCEHSIGQKSDKSNSIINYTNIYRFKVIKLAVAPKCR